MMELYPFQAEIIPAIRERNFLLADDCGLGKTYTALAASKVAKGPVLVVCPKSAKGWWEKVLLEEGEQVLVTRTGGRLHWSLVGDTRMYVVTHPEGLRMSIDQVPKSWDWIIGGEAHRFKSRKAKQTRALWKLKANRKLALTATPYGRSPADLWALLRWLYPDKYTSFWRFVGKYVRTYQPPRATYTMFLGPKNLSQLAEEIAPFFRKKRKEDVVEELPELIEAEVPVLINGEQARLYKDILQESYVEFQGLDASDRRMVNLVMPNVLARLTRLHQVACDPGLIGARADSAKVRWLQEWLEDNPDEPVIIVSKYRRFVERHKAELKMPVYVGGMSARQQRQALERFEKTGCLLATLDAVCESLNLQRAATMIVVDGHWSSTKAYQLKNRIHRIGQTRTCQVIHLLATFAEGRRRTTIDHLVRRAVKRQVSEYEVLQQVVREVQGAFVSERR